MSHNVVNKLMYLDDILIVMKWNSYCIMNKYIVVMHYVYNNDVYILIVNSIGNSLFLKK